MVRAAVERILFGANTYKATDLTWKDDQTLEFSLGPLPSAP